MRLRTAGGRPHQHSSRTSILDALLDKFPRLAATPFEQISQFIVSTFGSHRDTASIRRQLQTLRQKSGETVGAYAVAVTALVAELEEQQDHYIDLFVSGLRDDIAVLLGVTSPSTFAEAVTLAQKAEARLAARRGVPALQHQQQQHDAAYVSPPSARQSSRGLCFYCKKPGHVIRDCRKRKAAEQRRGGGQRRTVNAVDTDTDIVETPSDAEVCTAQTPGAVSLCIPIEVNGTRLDALVDTGASVG